MNRSEFRRLSREKVRDARVLLAGKRWSCAYYIIEWLILRFGGLFQMHERRAIISAR